MKKYAVMAFIGLVSMSLASCITTAKKGALVNVLRPNTTSASLTCSGSGEAGIAFVYVGNNSITGVNNSGTKKLIAQNARAVLSESKTINPVGIQPDGASEHPNLFVEVIELDVKTSKGKNRISKDGVFEANFSIKQPGGIDCYTAKPILVTRHYEMPAYKKERLPKDRQIQSEMITDAVRRALRQFVPVQAKVLRPVKEGSDVSQKAAAMIDGGNCVGAFELLKPVVKDPASNDAQAIYNAGVAAECAAWDRGADQKTQVAYLKVAEKQYTKAAALFPDDKDLQKARKEVSYELIAFYKAFLSQEELAHYMKTYETPDGY